MKLLPSNRKGVSTVIATVLLILLTITTIIVVSSFLIPQIKDNLNDSSKCNFYEGLNVIGENTCYDINANQTNISIKRGNVDIEGVYLVFDEMLTQEISNNLPAKGGGEKTYNFQGVYSDVSLGGIVEGKKCPIISEAELLKC